MRKQEMGDFDQSQGMDEGIQNRIPGLCAHGKTKIGLQLSDQGGQLRVVMGAGSVLYDPDLHGEIATLISVGQPIPGMDLSPQGKTATHEHLIPPLRPAGFVENIAYVWSQID